jgi:hypothetical protein
MVPPVSRFVHIQITGRRGITTTLEERRLHVSARLLLRFACCPKQAGGRRKLSRIPTAAVRHRRLFVQGAGTHLRALAALFSGIRSRASICAGAGACARAYSARVSHERKLHDCVERDATRGVSATRPSSNQQCSSSKTQKSAHPNAARSLEHMHLTCTLATLQKIMCHVRESKC